MAATKARIPAAEQMDDYYEERQKHVFDGKLQPDDTIVRCSVCGNNHAACDEYSRLHLSGALYSPSYTTSYAPMIGGRSETRFVGVHPLTTRCLTDLKQELQVLADGNRGEYVELAAGTELTKALRKTRRCFCEGCVLERRVGYYETKMLEATDEDGAAKYARRLVKARAELAAIVEMQLL